MKFKKIFSSFFIYLAFLGCLFPVAFFTYKHPAYNFDMLGYMALVVRMKGTPDLTKVHDITYAQAKQYIPVEDYKKLTAGLPVRIKFATDPSQFEKILPIYSVKPLYLALCSLFYEAGFPLPIATVLPSILAYLLIGLFLFYWLAKYLLVGIAFLTAFLIMCSTFVVGIAGLSTPDCLSAFFLFLSAYFIAEKRNFVMMLGFFLLSILTRVDNIIVCFFIASFLTFSPTWKRIGWRNYLLTVVLLGAGYVCAILPVTQFGWSVFYYSEYAKHIDFSRDFNEPIGLSSYLSLVWSKLVTALVSTQFTFFMFLCLLILGNPFRALKKFNFDEAFLLILLFVIFVRFLLLPDLSDRFYFGFYLIFIVLLVRKFYGSTLILQNENRFNRYE